MDINFTEASVLVGIDRNVDNSNFTPAQYELVRQVIYHTGDLEYATLLRFANDPLAKGYEALIAQKPVIVDVPAIQVSIVPKLQTVFANPVYCCYTTATKAADSQTRSAIGLENLASQYPQGIFIIGQDRTALATLIDLAKNQTINPSLAIVTSPTFAELKLEQNLAKYWQTVNFPLIYLHSAKGSATIATALFNGLVNLASRVRS